MHLCLVNLLGRSLLRPTYALSNASRALQSSQAVADADCPANEPLLEYTKEPHSKHRLELEKCLKAVSNQVQEVPIVIGGKEYTTNEARYQRVPFQHEHHIAKFYYASHELIHKAIKACLEAKQTWAEVSLEEKSKLFERAANLVAGKYRQQLNAATMMGQAKTIKQAEIDAACEMADFLRFNSYFAHKLHKMQPNSTAFEQNSTEFRPLDGFVAAISPFNFTAIGANLVAAPALMGNCIIWKPSDTAILSNYITLKVFQEAGLPPGVINFVPSEGLDFGRIVTGNEKLAGVNFTGSLPTFQWLWSEVGFNIKHYESFPRLAGECGGKNYHLVHKSAHLDTAIAQTIRSAFEYSGQKCSACSRLYVSASVWPLMKDKLVEIASQKLKLGRADDLESYTSAVIDDKAFNRIQGYINHAKSLPNEVQLLCGGHTDHSVGYFVEPTIFETKNPNNRLMMEEIFGPVLTVYVYDDNDLDRTLNLINSNEFALTGAIFAQDEQFVELAKKRLRMSAGNFYINDKSTGAVVGQQPFGGSRHSGTNDKAGGPHNLMRWCNQQTVKRTTKNMVDY